MMVALGAGVVGLASFGSTGNPPVVPNNANAAADPFGDAFPLPAGALARLAWDPLRLGHFRGALTPDGKKVVALSDAAIIHIFDAAAGKLLGPRPLGDRRERSTAIWGCSLSTDGSVAAVMDISNGNYRLTVRQLATGQRLLQLGSVSSSTYSLGPD